ncbi:TPA: 30S ribosomal protein S4 [Candidatus Taylorbacteria bacterium]|nr:30S ribosomal protein S4 [Candidatus Taylorbacteria bacterium]
MIIGPKYKIARRLNAPVFEKTQTPKYALSLTRKGKADKGRPKAKTNYGRQLDEKQKARYTYGINDTQFSKYAKHILASAGVVNKADRLLETLENRLDNIVYRSGLAVTRRFARQMVSHGHITVNGRRVTVPSFQASIGDMVGVRVNSLKSKLFATLDERHKTYTTPSWLSFDLEKRSAKVQGLPKVMAGDLLFDPKAVLEFYSR